MPSVFGKLVHGILLGDADTVAVQYKSYCNALAGNSEEDTKNDDQDENDDENPLFDQGVPFKTFTLVCINGSALLIKSADNTDLNDDYDGDESHYAWALSPLNDEAAATLHKALNEAAEELIGPANNSKPLRTFSIVSVY